MNIEDLKNLRNLIMNFKKHVIKAKKDFYPDGIMCVDKKTFLADNPNVSQSIFNTLDFDNDGYITETEYNRILTADINGDGNISKAEAKEYRQRCLEDALFFARRNIDKWFTVDIDRDGYWSNVESKMAGYRMSEEYCGLENVKDSALTNEELAKKYKMTEKKADSTKLESWMDEWLDYIKSQVMQNGCGIKLSDSEMKLLKTEMLKQLNTWLFKTGDNAAGDAPLYNSLNATSYTRLMTTEQAISCCGGDITPPPMAKKKNECVPVFRRLEFSQTDFEKAAKVGKSPDYRMLKNDSSEIKNRLAWAAFYTPSPEKLDRRPNHTLWESLSDKEYAEYHRRWEKLRNTTAKELRELLKPYNLFRRLEFESNTIMTVAQMVHYINIVESVTGKSWDDNNWEVNAAEFNEISLLVNDTKDDSKLLQGKSRNDVPQNRQKLLKFLEEKGWLYDSLADKKPASI